MICESDITTVQKSYTEMLGDFDIPQTGTYNLGGMSPGKKLSHLDLCRERRRRTRLLVSFGRQALYLRKSDGGLTTKTSANQRRPILVAQEATLKNQSFPTEEFMKRRRPICVLCKLPLIPLQNYVCFGFVSLYA